MYPATYKKTHPSYPSYFMDPFLLTIQVAVIVPLFILLNKVLLPERTMQPSSRTESAEVSRAMRAYTEDLSLPRQVGESSSHFFIFCTNNRARFSLKIFFFRRCFQEKRSPKDDLRNELGLARAEWFLRFPVTVRKSWAEADWFSCERSRVHYAVKNIIHVNVWRKWRTCDVWPR